MQMGCIVTVIRSGLIVSSWGGLSSSCRIAIVCHYSTSILRMNTVMHINVVLKWVFFFFFTATHYLERTPVCFWSPSQGGRFPETPPPARHLCKVGLAPRFDSGEIHSQNHHLFGEQIFSLKPIFFFSCCLMSFQNVCFFFFKFHRWPVCRADSFHSVSEAERMIAFLQCLLPLCLRSWMLSRHPHV